jgi:hypothetical protein
MGSGKGKQRRARAAFPVAAGYAVNELAFRTFVQEQGLADVRMVEYYSLPNPGVPDYTLPNPNILDVDKKVLDEWRVALATELFRDLVSVGAIELPSEVVAHDFTFEVATEPTLGEEALYMSHPSSTKRLSVELSPNHTYNAETKMGDDLWFTARSMCEAAEYVMDDEFSSS